jgi:hypothetical protein
MTRKPSDVLPLPDIGDKDPDAIFVAVGRALTLWEGVEDQLADLFAVLTGNASGKPASPAKRAYGTIAAFRGRQEMVATAAEAFFSNLSPEDADAAIAATVKAEVRSLLKSANDFSARRNEIAHGQVKKVEVSGPLLSRLGLASDETWYLQPAGTTAPKQPDYQALSGSPQRGRTLTRRSVSS